VLRPDLTTPIARVFATKLKNAPLPQRLYYVQSVFRSSLSHKGNETEIMQAGVELIGTNGIKSDLEALALAIASLRACGFWRFHIEIGHSGLFRALLSELHCSEDTAEEIRRQTEKKNFAALSDLIEPFRNLPAAASLKKLIELFGGEEVLQEAKTLASSEEANRCVDYLIALYGELKAAGLAECIRFDLGIVNQINYYTGIVFLGYVEGAGEPVLTGGRYDGLTASFGSDAPATGFGININAISRCVPPAETRVLDTVIHYEPGMLGKALDLLDGQTPGTCELSPCDDVTMSAALAAERNARRLVVIGADGGTSDIRIGKTERKQ
jgi:ATP phosphoribosyltransferase regulatory subunit